jgi:hypothetical protein
MEFNGTHHLLISAVDVNLPGKNINKEKTKDMYTSCNENARKIII